MHCSLCDSSRTGYKAYSEKGFRDKANGQGSKPYI